MQITFEDVEMLSKKKEHFLAVYLEQQNIRLPLTFYFGQMGRGTDGQMELKSS